MATTKKTTIIESDEPVVEAQPVQVITERSGETPSERASRQTILTIAIVSSVVLFFLGLGLGYLLGRSTVTTRGTMMDGRYGPGMMYNNDNNNSSYRRGFYRYDSGQAPTTNNNTQTAPQSQTN